MAKAHISGSADLADALAFVFRHLRWDIEEDLSGFVGDIAAHRLAAVGKRLAEAPRRLADAIVGKEPSPVAKRAESATLAGGIQALEADLAALEKRLGRRS
jgi:ubiquinone biosynthesis protein UbiJ